MEQGKDLRESCGSLHSGKESREQEGIEAIVNESAKHIVDSSEDVGFLRYLGILGGRWLLQEGFGNAGDDRQLRRIT